MKLMTFNTQHCLNYVERKIDFNIMARAIETCGADVVGLQEMRGAGKDEDYAEQAEILSELSGLRYWQFGKARDASGGPYGNAVLSRYPILCSNTVLIPNPEQKTGNRPYEQRAILKVKLEGGITVLVTHFGLNYDEQKNAVDTVISNLEDRKCILMGDFNLEPDSELLRPIREIMKDASELFCSGLKSFPSDNPTKKLDYIFVSPDVEIISADIPAIIASDHRPHVANVIPEKQSSLKGN